MGGMTYRISMIWLLCKPPRVQLSQLLHRIRAKIKKNGTQHSETTVDSDDSIQIQLYSSYCSVPCVLYWVLKDVLLQYEDRQGARVCPLIEPAITCNSVREYWVLLTTVTVYGISILRGGVWDSYVKMKCNFICIIIYGVEFFRKARSARLGDIHGLPTYTRVLLKSSRVCESNGQWPMANEKLSMKSLYVIWICIYT
jgi:hypothetical protein